MNSLFSNELYLDRKSHKYFLKNNPAACFISCTKFIEGFFEKFDNQRIAEKLVTHVPKYLGRTVDDLITEWNKSAQDGTDIHGEIEELLRSQKEPSSQKAIAAKRWMSECLSGRGLILYPEVSLYSLEFGIAGTVDVLIYDPSKDLYYIADWKTNRRIDKQAYGNKRGIIKPTEDLADCNFTKYSLQLSLYRLILESAYGLKVRGLMLVHLKETGAEMHKCQYMKDKLMEMLQFGSIASDLIGSDTKEESILL